VIVADTPDFWVLNKRHGASINDEASQPGFITMFREQHELLHAHPVHRLDKQTSGLLLVAKHPAANRELSNLFLNKLIRKRYVAVIKNSKGKRSLKKQGWIAGDMAKSRNGNWMLQRSQNNPARTYFKTVSIAANTRLAVLFPQTGKTHQLRVAMRSISCPIVGDARYGGEAAERLYLHSAGLAFEYHGQVYCYEHLPEWKPFISNWDDYSLHDETFWPV
jgi:tRNA pseudouridine32 synthase/23S rRNA pseudouridine746 synthase